MKGSSKLFNEFFAHKRESADHEDAPPPEIKYMDLFIFSEKDVKWFEERGCEMYKVNMDPGDLVLWDSRTIHCKLLRSIAVSTLLTLEKDARFPEGNQIRHVQYVCMTPRKFATEEALKAKAYCFETYTGTTHWPHW